MRQRWRWERQCMRGEEGSEQGGHNYRLALMCFHASFKWSLHPFHIYLSLPEDMIEPGNGRIHPISFSNRHGWNEVQASFHLVNNLFQWIPGEGPSDLSFSCCHYLEYCCLRWTAECHTLGRSCTVELAFPWYRHKLIWIHGSCWGHSGGSLSIWLDLAHQSPGDICPSPLPKPRYGNKRSLK